MKRKATSYQNRPFKKPRQNGITKPSTFAARNLAINRQVGGQETKYHTGSFSTDATSTPTNVAFTSIATGSDRLTRNGNKIALKSVAIRVSYNLESIGVPIKHRWLLVLDKQANAAAFATADLLDNGTIESFQNTNSFGRFTVLMDKVITTNITNATAGAFTKGFFKKYIKIPLDNQIANYNVSSAAVPYTNSLSLLYLSDTVAGTTDIDVSGQFRVKFIG